MTLWDGIFIIRLVECYIYLLTTLNMASMTKLIVGGVVALLLFGIMGAIGIDAVADMDTDGDTNNTDFSALATLLILPALALVVGVGVKLGRGFGIF